jgi:hypothetical protein
MSTNQWISGLGDPLPIPPHKGEGVSSSVRLDLITPTSGHPPLEGEGWGGVSRTLELFSRN